MPIPLNIDTDHRTTLLVYHFLICVSEIRRCQCFTKQLAVSVYNSTTLKQQGSKWTYEYTQQGTTAKLLLKATANSTIGPAAWSGCMPNTSVHCLTIRMAVE